MNTGEITSPTFLIITRFSRCSRPKGELDSFARRHTLIFHLPFVISILFIPFSFSLSLSFRRYVLVWFASDCTMTTMQHGVISFFFSFFRRTVSRCFSFFLCSPDHCLTSAEARRWRTGNACWMSGGTPCPLPARYLPCRCFFEACLRGTFSFSIWRHNIQDAAE